MALLVFVINCFLLGFLIEGFEKGHSGLDLFSLESFSSLLAKTVVIFIYLSSLI